MVTAMWKQVIDFPNYVVNENGDIKNINTGHLLSPWITGTGYRSVNLWKENKKYVKRVCRIVAFAFCDGYFDGAEVNHKDENILNDNAENLEWVSHVYNMNYGTRTKRVVEKMSIPIIGTINGIDTIYPSTQEASRQLGISPSNICNCLKGRMSHSHGIVWRYA